MALYNGYNINSAGRVQSHTASGTPPAEADWSEFLQEDGERGIPEEEGRKTQRGGPISDASELFCIHRYIVFTFTCREPDISCRQISVDYCDTHDIKKTEMEAKPSPNHHRNETKNDRSDATVADSVQRLPYRSFCFWLSLCSSVC